MPHLAAAAAAAAATMPAMRTFALPAYMYIGGGSYWVGWVWPDTP